MAKTEDAPKKRFCLLKNKYFLIVVVALLIIGPSYYFYDKFQKTQELLKNPTLAAKEEIDSLIVKVGKLIELPKNETPTLATVTQKDKLEDQPFFKNSKNNDKVLIFTKSGKAILYRPSTNKIIEVAPININDVSPVYPETTASAQNKPITLSPTVSQIRAVVYNGTQESGLALQTKTKIEGEFSQIKVTSTTNSVEDYDKTIVVDLTGKNKELATNIAKFLSGEVKSLPSSETKPDADILIIVGE